MSCKNVSQGTPHKTRDFASVFDSRGDSALFVFALFQEYDFNPLDMCIIKFLAAWLNIDVCLISFEKLLLIMDEVAALREQFAALAKENAELRAGATALVKENAELRARPPFVAVGRCWADEDEATNRLSLEYARRDRYHAHFHAVLTKQVPKAEPVVALLELLERHDEAPGDDRVLIRNYVRELWLSEQPSPEAVVKQTLALVNHAADGAKEKFIAELCRADPTMSEAQADEWWTTVDNLHVAAKCLFDRSTGELQRLLANSPHLLPEGNVVSVQMIKEIHNMTMRNLVATSGQLRRCDVFTVGSSVVYAAHANVEKFLEQLVCETNAAFKALGALAPSDERLQRQLAAAAVFFSHLLHIHPFEDGNGRTARLALSFVLRGITAVPVSLCINSGSRKDYVNALEYSHLLPDWFPFRVVAYVTTITCLRAVHDQKPCEIQPVELHSELHSELQLSSLCEIQPVAR
ncbi:Hypothetical protein, putative [Bodo saltans]|uniref:Fido domain-containing protein n=1 Tax=Bodo saltans TaxID=75058 RepID=A0A0S4JDS7_BODSA|nr:Hypothetical protein, putative [Bodo saltans]|eukprot:CUG88127.1 Hypothetical protein, putative [Bodo saltans]